MPDATNVRISVPAELEAVGAQILAIATAIEGELTTLKGQLAPLASSWSGTANVSWQDLQTMWDNAANNLMSTTLTVVAQTSNTNWTNYVDAEAANVATWNHQ